MRDAVLIRMLVAIREQLDAVIAHLAEQAPCPHDNVQDLSTFDRKEWICLDCGEHYNPSE